MIVAAKQNQKFPFHFLSAPPTPPRKRRKVRKIFGFCSRDRRERTRRASFCIRIVLEKSSDFVQETQPKNRITVFAKMRSIAKRRDWGFRQNSPRVLKSKRSERDARRGFMMSTSFKTKFCEPIRKRIIINI